MKIFGINRIRVNDDIIYTAKLNFKDDSDIKAILSKNQINWFENKTKRGTVIGVSFTTMDPNVFNVFTHNLAIARREIDMLKISKKYWYLEEPKRVPERIADYIDLPF
jgi:hypothetical protein